jgi:hypothetical protein
LAPQPRIISIKELKDLATERLNTVATGCATQLFAKPLPLARLNRRSEEIVTLSARNGEQRLTTSAVTAERLKLAQKARPRFNERPNLFAKRQALRPAIKQIALAGSIPEPLLIVLAMDLNAWCHLGGESSDRDELIIDARHRTTLRVNFAHDDLLATFAAHQEVDSQSIFTSTNRACVCTGAACQRKGIHDETLSGARLARQDGEAGAELYAYGINNGEPSNAKLTNL